MFQQIQAAGSIIIPMQDIMLIADSMVKQNPTHARQQGMYILNEHGGNNQVVRELEAKVIGILRGAPNAPMDAVIGLVHKSAELCLLSAALKVHNPANVYGQGYQAMMQSKADLVNALAQWAQRFGSPQMQHRQPTMLPSAQSQGNGGQYMAAYDDHSAPTSNYNDQWSSVNNQPREAAYDPSITDTSFESIPDIGGPVTQASSGFEIVDTEESVLSPFDDSAWGDITDTFNNLEVTDTLTSEYEEVTMPEVELEASIEHTPERDIDHEVVDSLSDIELFSTQKEWATLLLDGDKPVLGAVSLAGALFIPVSRKVAESRARLGYVEFLGLRAMNGNKPVTEKVYFALEDLPMDYETLSPNPIVIHDSAVTIKREPDLASDEYAYRIQHRTIKCKNDGSGGTATAALAGGMISSVGKYLAHGKDKRVKTGLFIAWEQRTLDIVTLKDIKEFIAPELDVSMNLAALLDSHVGLSCRGEVVSRLAAELNEMLTTRLDIASLTFTDLIGQWEVIRGKVAAALDYDAGVIELEFERILMSVLLGDHYTVRELSDLVTEPVKSFDENNVIAVATQPAGEGKYYALLTNTPTATFASWLTNDEMGLLKDERLSTVTHSVIAEPILGAFETYPTLQKIKVIDVNGESTLVYRGVGRARCTVVCD